VQGPFVKRDVLPSLLGSMLETLNGNDNGENYSLVQLLFGYSPSNITNPSRSHICVLGIGGRGFYIPM